MPCDYRQYHPEWKSIRRQILDQADHCCEFCGVANGAFGTRERDGSFRRLDELGCDVANCSGERCIRIVLTIAHLDHDVSNNEPSNLRALCQRCHLRWDIEHHQRNAGETRRLKRVHAGQLEMITS